MRMIGKTMPWKCLDCHAKFEGPCDRTPINGCAVCGSKRIFDCNVEPVSLVLVSQRRRRNPSLSRHFRQEKFISAGSAGNRGDK